VADASSKAPVVAFLVGAIVWSAMKPNIAHAREHKDPVDGDDPVPRLLWVAIGGLLVWGFTFVLLYTGGRDEIAADMRTVSDAEITAVLTHVRASFGNTADRKDPWTADELSTP
jgi:hypothetical protein